MSDRYKLNETRSPIDPSSWRELNDNWTRIEAYLVYLQNQIRLLAGGQEIDEIVNRIEAAIADAQDVTTDARTAIETANSLLTQLSTAISNANSATGRANTAADDANILNVALSALRDELETLQTELTDIAQTEAQRVSNEQSRTVSEQTRQVDETTRKNNETDRVLKEQARVTAEQTRTNTFDAQLLTTNQKIALMQGLIDNLKSYEYNPSAIYNFPNLIKWNGSTFIALKSVSGIAPKDDGINYRLVAQRGVDGTGAVASVNNVLPDPNGNVEIPTQKTVISGLDVPVEDREPGAFYWIITENAPGPAGTIKVSPTMGLKITEG